MKFRLFIAFSDFGTYDFAVIGGGATGSVIANRLSEIDDWKILLLEAGEFINDFVEIPYYHLPAMFSKYNWGYESIPQETACLGTSHSSKHLCDNYVN